MRKKNDVESWKAKPIITTATAAAAAALTKCARPDATPARRLAKKKPNLKKDLRLSDLEDPTRRPIYPTAPAAEAADYPSLRLAWNLRTPAVRPSKKAE